MPLQEQDSYWSCDFCGQLGFRSADEAKAHEFNCPRKRHRPGSSAQEHPHNVHSNHQNQTQSEGQSQGQGHIQPTNYGGMAPLSAAVAAEMNTGSMPRHHPPHHNGDAPQGPRHMPLLAESSHPRLSMKDVLACQNVELFEATQQHAADNKNAPGGSVVFGQVGIRCMHCPRSPHTPVDYSSLFPTMPGYMGASVRMVAEQHLHHCTMTPGHVRQMLARPPDEGEDNARNKEELMNYCVDLCDRLGVYQSKSGLFFSDAQRDTHSHPNTPGQMMRPTGGEDLMAATPLVRRTKQDSLQHSGNPSLNSNDQSPHNGTTEGYEHQREGHEYAAFQPQYPHGNTPLAHGQNHPHGQSPHPHGQQTPLPHRHGQSSSDAMYRGAQEPTPGMTPSHHSRSESSQGASPHPGVPSPHGATHSPHAVVSTSNQSSPPQEQQGFGQQQGYDMQQQQPAHPPQSSYPYFQDHTGAWVCRYCSTVHPQYREPGSIWSSPNHSPPPGQFIDQHLGICRGYNHHMQHQHPGPPGWAGLPHQQYGYPPNIPYGGQPGWGQPATQQGHTQHPQTGHQQQGGNPMAQQQQPHSHYSPQQQHPDQQQQQQQHYQYPPHGHPHEHHTNPHGPPMMPPSSHGGHPTHQGTSHAINGVPPALGIAPTTPRAPTTTSGLPHPEGGDAAARNAIEHLIASERMQLMEKDAPGENTDLVLDEDKLLLTDYFYYLMKQLRLCRFSEADRKTRGGKRENIAIGYGGLQCVHCADAPNSRKFFWSNVDRLANSFAEIPGHVLKCRRCPNQTKTALMELKIRHPEQMARLPRGSQKVFFRRMWRRLHDSDPQANQSSAEKATSLAQVTSEESPSPQDTEVSKVTADTTGSKQSSPGTISDESAVVERTTEEAARALAISITSNSGPTSPSSRIFLAIAEDKEWLSDMDCFIRRQLDVFCASERDVAVAQSDRKYPVNLGQVGIRCIHCACAKDGNGARGPAVAYPYTISGIYESVREFQRLHLEGCNNLPKSTKTKLAGFKGSASLSSVLRKYYVIAAKALGMFDTPDGIRGGAESVPLGSSAAFAFSESSSRVSAQMRAASSGGAFMDSAGPAITPLESRKRKQLPLSAGSTGSQHSSKKR